MPLTITPGGVGNSLLFQSDRNARRTNQAFERLSTGLRINRGRDDPAGLIAAEQLKGEISELSAQINSYERQNASLTLQESTYASVQRQLGDIRGYAVSAAGNLLSDTERAALQQSVDASVESIGRLAGELAPDGLYRLSLGGDASLADDAAAAALAEGAAGEVLDERVAIAAEQRSLDALQRVAEDTVVITYESLSQIEDAEYAAETSELATSQILGRASLAALAYSTQSKGDLIGSLLDAFDRGPRSLIG